MYYTYVLYSEKDHGLYIGYSADLKARFKQHTAGEVSSTAHRRSLILAYYEAYVYRRDAETRERFLKSGSGRTYLKKQMREFFSYHPLRTVQRPCLE
jgi:putative endonuclease